MTDMTPSRLGQINEAGNSRALSLKVFPGEVMGAFNTANVMFGSDGSDSLHTMKTIASGKSAQFPATGIVEAEYHTPGNRYCKAALGDLP